MEEGRRIVGVLAEGIGIGVVRGSPGGRNRDRGCLGRRKKDSGSPGGRRIVGVLAEGKRMRKSWRKEEE